MQASTESLFPCNCILFSLTREKFQASAVFCFEPFHVLLLAIAAKCFLGGANASSLIFDEFQAAIAFAFEYSRMHWLAIEVRSISYKSVAAWSLCDEFLIASEHHNIFLQTIETNIFSLESTPSCQPTEILQPLLVIHNFSQQTTSGKLVLGNCISSFLLVDGFQHECDCPGISQHTISEECVPDDTAK